MATSATAPARKCPICGKPTQPAFAPFCSARCRDVDLNRWLSGAYRVETNDAPDDDSAPNPHDQT